MPIATKIGVTLSVVAALLAPSASFAQSPELKTKLESVSQSIDKLVEAKEELTFDVDVRKKALSDIFNLSIAEIKALQEKLQVIRRDNDRELILAKDQFEEDLKKFLKFVETEKLELGFEASTKASLQRRAGAFKTWREEIYDPEVRDIFDLLILLQGKALVSTANVRLRKIASDVDKLKTTFGQKADGLDIFIDQAGTHLTTAAENEQKAHLLFVQNFSDDYFPLAINNPDSFFASVLESLKPKPEKVEPVVEAEVVDEKAAEAAVEEPPKEPDTVQSLIRQSLEEVTKAYKVFLELIKFAKLQKFIP